MNRLHEKYVKEVSTQIKSEFGLKNAHETTKLLKVVLNVGMGEASKNKEFFEQIKRDLAQISGQKAQVRPAKSSVASFAIRTGQPVGLRVTLRKERMYAFLDRLFSIVLPRLRDFRGLSLSSFDNQGNYTLGIPEHTVFPEIDMIKSAPKGLEITIVTNTKDVKMTKRLLELLGMPFEKNA